VTSDPKEGAGEIRRLQGFINDLISLQTLPAIWDGRESGSIVSTLLDVLGTTLRLNFAYVRLGDSINGLPVEFLQLAQRRAPSPQASEIVAGLLLSALWPEQLEVQAESNIKSSQPNNQQKP
jgi:hypothetical protein